MQSPLALPNGEKMAWEENYGASNPIFISGSLHPPFASNRFKNSPAHISVNWGSRECCCTDCNVIVIVLSCCRELGSLACCFSSFSIPLLKPFTFLLPCDRDRLWYDFVGLMGGGWLAESARSMKTKEILMLFSAKGAESAKAIVLTAAACLLRLF